MASRAAASYKEADIEVLNPSGSMSSVTYSYLQRLWREEAQISEKHDLKYATSLVPQASIYTQIYWFAQGLERVFFLVSVKDLWMVFVQLFSCTT